MKIKSYFADSVEQAIQEARQELGNDAMLITSRRSSPETRSLGAYEVVFGLNAPAVRQRPAAARPADLSSELQNLRSQLQEIKSALQGPRGGEALSSDAEQLFDELVSGDLARNIAQEIVSSATRLRDQLSAGQPSSHPLRDYAAELISKKLRFAGSFPHFARNEASPNPASSESAPVVVFCRTSRSRQNHHAHQNRDSRMPGSKTARPHSLVRSLPCRRARKVAQLRRYHWRWIHRPQFRSGVFGRRRRVS